jgi:hypothetical protein
MENGKLIVPRPSLSISSGALTRRVSRLGQNQSRLSLRESTSFRGAKGDDGFVSGSKPTRRNNASLAAFFGAAIRGLPPAAGKKFLSWLEKNASFTPVSLLSVASCSKPLTLLHSPNWPCSTERLSTKIGGLG